MRHLLELTPDEILLLPARVIQLARLGLLVPKPRLPHRFTAAGLGAVLAAMALPDVALAAEEEHLAATAADHES